MKKVMIIAVIFGVIATTTIAARSAVNDGETGRDHRPDDLASSVAFSSSIPYGTLEDWVSYANQVSVVTVVSEREIPPPREVLERREGYVGRAVELRIEHTIWEAEGAVTISGTLEITGWGWILRGDSLTPFGGRMEVGRQYLVPLALTDGQWASMALTAIPIDGSRVAEKIAQDYVFAEGLAGSDLEDLRLRLANTSADPVALEFWHITDPVARYEAVQMVKAGRMATPTAEPE